MNISVVIVNWNVRELLRRSLTSVYGEAAALPSGAVEVVVVDNNSTDGSADMVAAGFPDVRLLVNPENRGFSAAFNQALPHCTGDAILLLNPDAELQPGSMTALSAHLEARPHLGAAGPMLLNADGSVQSSRRRFPTLATAFLESTVLQSYLPRNRHLDRYYCLDTPEDREQEVDWLVGACLLLRRSALEEVGGLDERFFLYFEEVDWFRRAHTMGWRTAYVPQARVLHHYGQSSAQNLQLRHTRFMESKVRYYAKHYGPLAAWCVRSFLLVSYAWQLFEESAKLALRHKVSLRRERIGLLTRILRWGLLG